MTTCSICGAQKFFDNLYPKTPSDEEEPFYCTSCRPSTSGYSKIKPLPIPYVCLKLEPWQVLERKKAE